jgi:hypothetical protein
MALLRCPTSTGSPRDGGRIRAKYPVALRAHRPRVCSTSVLTPVSARSLRSHPPPPRKRYVVIRPRGGSPHGNSTGENELPGRSYLANVHAIPPAKEAFKIVRDLSRRTSRVVPHHRGDRARATASQGLLKQEPTVGVLGRKAIANEDDRSRSRNGIDNLAPLLSD